MEIMSNAFGINDFVVSFVAILFFLIFLSLIPLGKEF